MSARKVFIGGNWKCNGSIKFIDSHINFLNTIVFDPKKCDVVISPTFLHLHYANSLIKNDIKLSAQNVSMKGEGAFTGEVSAKQIFDLGVHWTLVGHSERRTLYGETDEIVGQKVKIAQENQLKTIACIGESLAERKANQTIQVCYKQLEAIAQNVQNWRNTVIAYEPVWAIGTGESATKEQAQEVHSQLRYWLLKNISQAVSDITPIIYGGS